MRSVSSPHGIEKGQKTIAATSPARVSQMRTDSESCSTRYCQMVLTTMTDTATDHCGENSRDSTVICRANRKLTRTCHTSRIWVRAVCASLHPSHCTESAHHPSVLYDHMCHLETDFDSCTWNRELPCPVPSSNLVGMYQSVLLQ